MRDGGHRRLGDQEETAMGVIRMGKGGLAIQDEMVRGRGYVGSRRLCSQWGSF